MRAASRNRAALEKGRGGRAHVQPVLPPREGEMRHRVFQRQILSFMHISQSVQASQNPFPICSRIHGRKALTRV